MQHIMPHYSPTMWDHTLNAEKWLLHPMFHRQQPTSCFKKTSDAPWWFIASSQSSDGLSLAHLITHIDLFEGWALQAMPNSKQSATTWNFECKKLNHTHTHTLMHAIRVTLHPLHWILVNVCVKIPAVCSFVARREYIMEAHTHKHTCNCKCMHAIARPYFQGFLSSHQKCTKMLYRNMSWHRWLITWAQ